MYIPLLGYIISYFARIIIKEYFHNALATSICHPKQDKYSYKYSNKCHLFKPPIFAIFNHIVPKMHIFMILGKRCPALGLRERRPVGHFT